MIEVTDPKKMEQYQAGVLRTVEQYGGSYRLVGGKCDVVEGNWKPAFPVLIEFPSLEQAHGWYNSKEYENVKALRLAGSNCNAVFMESEPSEFVSSK